jgi:hypothetical protein
MYGLVPLRWDDKCHIATSQLVLAISKQSVCSLHEGKVGWIYESIGMPSGLITGLNMCLSTTDLLDQNSRVPGWLPG